MATDAELLKTRRSAILAELAAATSTSGIGKPNTVGGGDKVSIDWERHRAGLYDELRQINETLIALEGVAIIETQYEV